MQSPNAEHLALSLWSDCSSGPDRQSGWGKGWEPLGPSLGHIIALPLFFLCPISLSPFPLPQLSDSTSSLRLELQGRANSPPTPSPRRLSASGPEHSVLPLSSLSALLLNSLRLLLLAIACIHYFYCPGDWSGSSRKDSQCGFH